MSEVQIHKGSSLHDSFAIQGLDFTAWSSARLPYPGKRQGKHTRTFNGHWLQIDNSLPGSTLCVLKPTYEPLS